MTDTASAGRQCRSWVVATHLISWWQQWRLHLCWQALSQTGLHEATANHVYQAERYTASQVSAGHSFLQPPKTPAQCNALPPAGIQVRCDSVGCFEISSAGHLRFKAHLLEKEEVKLDCSIQQQGWQKYVEEQSVWLNVQPESHRVAQATQVPWEQYALQSSTCTSYRSLSEFDKSCTAPKPGKPLPATRTIRLDRRP